MSREIKFKAPELEPKDELDEIRATANIDEDIIVEAILITPFLYGIQSDLLSKDEVEHRVLGYKNTDGYKETKAKLQALITQRELRARIDELRPLRIPTQTLRDQVDDRIAQLKSNQQGGSDER